MLFAQQRHLRNITMYTPIACLRLVAREKATYSAEHSAPPRDFDPQLLIIAKHVFGLAPRPPRPDAQPFLIRGFDRFSTRRAARIASPSISFDEVSPNAERRLSARGRLGEQQGLDVGHPAVEWPDSACLIPHDAKRGFVQIADKHFFGVGSPSTATSVRHRDVERPFVPYKSGRHRHRPGVKPVALNYTRVGPGTRCHVKAISPPAGQRVVPLAGAAK